MSEEEDRVFFKNYAIIIGILAAMIVIFIILARVIIGTDDSNSVNASENTAPVGEVRLVGDEEPVQVAAAPAATATNGAANQGKQVYSGLCISCHGTGIPGIPQLGDAGAWTDRLAQGTDVLYDHAINGFTGSSGIPMLPRGGNASLSDDEVKAAVDYMIANSQSSY